MFYSWHLHGLEVSIVKSVFSFIALVAFCLLLGGCGGDGSEVTATEKRIASPVVIEIVKARIPPAPKPGEAVTPFDNTGQAYFEVKFVNTGAQPITQLKLKFNHPRIGLADQTIFSERDPLAPNKSKTRQFTIDLLDKPGEADATISVLDWSPR